MNIRAYILYIAAAASSLIACTSVDTIETSDLNSANKWNIAFNWEPNATRPDSMLVIANRAINTYRYIYNWNLEKGKAIKLYESTDLGYKKTNLSVDSTQYNPTDTLESESQKVQNGQNILASSNEEIQVRPGQYTALTASLNKNIVYTCLNQTGFQQFMDSTVSVREVSIYYKTVTTDSIFSKFGRRWSDFNPSEQFVDDIGPIYFDEKKQITVNDGKQTSIQFTPRDITQKLTIKFRIILRGTPLYLDDILGTISGIPGNVRMSSLYINTGATRKMAFRPELKNLNDTVIECTSRMTVPGLLASLDTTRLIGPGVLQLALFAATQASNGENVRKTFYVGRNVSPEIREGNFSKFGDDNLHLIINGKEIEINISTPIIVDRETILALPDNESSMNRWNIDEDFKQEQDIEI